MLGGAVVSEGATLMVALSAIRKGAKEANVTLSEYGNYCIDILNGVMTTLYCYS